VSLGLGSPLLPRLLVGFEGSFEGLLGFGGVEVDEGLGLVLIEVQAFEDLVCFGLDLWVEGKAFGDFVFGVLFRSASGGFIALFV
jgi:hypothetical protein